MLCDQAVVNTRWQSRLVRWQVLTGRTTIPAARTASGTLSPRQDTASNWSVLILYAVVRLSARPWCYFRVISLVSIDGCSVNFCRCCILRQTWTALRSKVKVRASPDMSAEQTCHALLSGKLLKLFIIFPVRTIKYTHRRTDKQAEVHTHPHTPSSGVVRLMKIRLYVFSRTAAVSPRTRKLTASDCSFDVPAL